MRYYGGSPEHMDRIIEQHLIGGRMLEDLVFHFGPALEATRPGGAGQPQGPEFNAAVIRRQGLI